jgi:hypothetical protein
MYEELAIRTTRCPAGAGTRRVQRYEESTALRGKYSATRRVQRYKSSNCTMINGGLGSEWKNQVHQ